MTRLATGGLRETRARVRESFAAVAAGGDRG
jgi:hypothetical protein